MIGASEQVIEIRYRANPRILDFRGRWADRLSSHMALSQWNVQENRIEVSDEEKGEIGFIGHRNCGYTTRRANDKEYFVEKSAKFIKYLFSKEDFGTKIFVDRIGVRNRLFYEHKGEFSELLIKCAEKYGSLSPDVKRIYGSDISDIGYNVNFKNADSFISTGCGPMRSGQALQYFPWSKGLPAVGLYVDIDYWSTPSGELGERDIVEKLKQYQDYSWRVGSEIANHIF